ncbi:DNA-directed DNA polymerase [Sergentomyia squamirostris]
MSDLYLNVLLATMGHCQLIVVATRSQESGKLEEEALNRHQITDEFENVCSILLENQSEPPYKKFKQELVQSGSGVASSSSSDHQSDIVSNDVEDENVEDINGDSRDENIEIVEKVKSYNNHFKMSQLLLNFKIKKPLDDSKIDWLEEGFDRLIEIIRTEAKDGEDKIVMQLYLEENSTNRPLFIGLRYLDTLSSDVIFTCLEKVQQSTSAFSSTDVMGIRAFLLQPGEGRGRAHKPSRMTGDDFRQYKKNSIIDLDLDENCLPNALIFEMTNTDSCTHSENERLLTGTWSLDEIRLAVEHGYKIYQIFTVWQYKTTQYNRESDDRGLFADYVDNFLKIKQQSSGWPAGIESDVTKEEYVREYLEKEGIQLDPAEIRVNKGMRSLAKIVLNSLWGRFIMRDDHPKTQVCNSFEDLNKLVSSEDIDILNFYYGGPKQLFVSYKYRYDADAPVNKYGNIGVGICTTTNARIKLYSVLSKLGRNLFYCDTDSMIYVVPNGQTNPLECGKFLGELTDEIEEHGENSFIEEFVSCGPKAYGLKINLKSTNSYKYKIVFKGITMNRHVEQKICFQGLKDMVFGEKEEVEVEYSDHIVRRKHFKIESGPSKKKAQFSFTKRRCIQNFDTVPFGY